LGQTQISDATDEGAIHNIARGLSGYLLGLILAALLTVASFWAAGTHLMYAPAIPVGQYELRTMRLPSVLEC
jgi:cytochrome o ubiquinol oxidase operon protein cyoD